MIREVLLHLAPERGGLFVDCTVGPGGHARALLEGGATRLLGLDRDEAALAIARETLAPWADRVELALDYFRKIETAAPPPAPAGQVAPPGAATPRPRVIPNLPRRGRIPVPGTPAPNS